MFGVRGGEGGDPVGGVGGEREDVPVLVGGGGVQQHPVEVGVRQLLGGFGVGVRLFGELVAGGEGFEQFRGGYLILYSFVCLLNNGRSVIKNNNK